MGTGNWRELAEFLGIAAIVASLIFVGLQFRQDRQIANSDLLVGQQVLDVEIAALIDQRRDVWRKGLAGEDLTDDEKVSFDLMAYSLFRQQANDYRQKLEFGDADDSDVTSYAFFVYQNPGLRRWFDALIEVRTYRDRAFGFSDDVRYFPKVVNTALRQLDEANPKLPGRYYNPY